MTALGERIKALRREHALQQRQLAEKAELTPSMVSQIESGRLTPSLHTLGKIAAALSVPIGALFDGQPAGRRDFHRVTAKSAALCLGESGAGSQIRRGGPQVFRVSVSAPLRVDPALSRARV